MLNTDDITVVRLKQSQSASWQIANDKKYYVTPPEFILKGPSKEDVLNQLNERIEKLRQEAPNAPIYITHRGELDDLAESVNCVDNFWYGYYTAVVAYQKLIADFTESTIH